jgi:hypothetical protein
VARFRSKQEKALIEQWRRRSAELPDAGPLSWKVVWESLLVDPGNTTGAMAPIGLSAVAVPMRGGTAAAYQGTRHGRVVHVRTGQVGRPSRAVSAVWVGVVSPAFTGAGTDGRVSIDAGPESVADSLATLSVAPRVWDRVTVGGGPDGTIVAREVSTRVPQAWIHDLWLAERLAHVCGDPVLPPPGGTYWDLPYGVPSEPWSGDPEAGTR